jgi:hypothetical protein
MKHFLLETWERSDNFELICDRFYLTVLYEVKAAETLKYVESFV